MAGLDPAIHAKCAEAGAPVPGKNSIAREYTSGADRGADGRVKSGHDTDGTVLAKPAGRRSLTA